MKEKLLCNLFKRSQDCLIFKEIGSENTYKFYSYYDYDGSEEPYLDFNCCGGKYFKKLIFDLNSDFYKVTDYGIELIPLNGESIKIRGFINHYSSNDPVFLLIKLLK